MNSRRFSRTYRAGGSLHRHFWLDLAAQPDPAHGAEKTGRVLAIIGALKVKFGWPLPRIHADAVTFANPGWAREKQMVAADAVEIAIDLPHSENRKKGPRTYA